MNAPPAGVVPGHVQVFREDCRQMFPANVVVYFLFGEFVADFGKRVGEF